MSDPHPLDARTFRRALRRNANPAEQRLWRALRGRQLSAKWRRQHSMGPFVLDFFCAEARLAIELDGDAHWAPGAQEYDARRTAFVEREGIRVLRFTNPQVYDELDGVLQAIWDAVRERVRRPPSPLPSPPAPRGERETDDGLAPSRVPSLDAPPGREETDGGLARAASPLPPLAGGEG